MSEPPVPWKDDPEIDADLRAELRSVREDSGDYDSRRGLVRLEAAIAAAATATAASAAQATSAGAGKAAAGKLVGGSLWKGTLAKVVVVTAAAVGVTSGVWVAGQTAVEPEAANAAGSTSVAAVEERVPASAPVAPEELVEAPRERGAEDAEPSGAVAGGMTAAATTTATATSTTTAEAEADGVQGLREEMQQLQRARSLLDRDPEAAYALLRRSSRRFARGLFVEEREALSVLALFGMGKQGAAEKRARAFAQRYPDSTFHARIRQARDAAAHTGAP